MSIKLPSDFKDSEPIMDSIYGIIKLSQFEKKLISTKEMQRLRGIKQLGFVSLVYPDAEHSRFAHSLGVCHQSKMLMEQVSKNILNTIRYVKWRTKFSRAEIKAENHTITEIERIVISAAALLHDLPHSPFSHEIENPSSDSLGIPIHDDYKHNHIFFTYLFNKEKSDLAKVIDIYNPTFWDEVSKDKKWGEHLINNKGIDKEGYIQILLESDAIISSNENIDLRLPLLGVMIFEIMLFEKTTMWLKYDEEGKLVKDEKGELIPNDKGVEIIINNDGDKVFWKPIEKWFRPYRKDIIANTICSDLLDYLLRDGRNTGIIPALDLKFFDRMAIAKAIPEKTDTLIPLSKIPDFCEHIVFDIYDHKRGVIRQSIITEIISFLQQRYLLSERVYEHRVVEGARSMLQEASRLLSYCQAIKVDELHNVSTNKSSPINDEAFFSWVLDMEDNDKKEIVKAQHLIRMLRERRIFREVVIIDGILGQHKGTYRGSDVDCKTLADALLGNTTRIKIIDSLVDETIKFCHKHNIQNVPNKDTDVFFTVGVRKYGKRYKIPRVLVVRPLNNDQDDDIEIFPLFEGKKLPAINDRLESMQHAYNSLWKVFLFIHPFFHHHEFIELHETLCQKFLTSLYEETNIKWVNSIDEYKDLLPEQAIDIYAFVNKHSIKKLTKKDNDEFLKNLIETINTKIPFGAEEFKLKPTHKKALEGKLRKIKEKNIFADAELQDKVIKNMHHLKPEIAEAARDKEELILNQIATFVQKIIVDEGRLFV